MSNAISLDFEYIAAHISDHIKEGNFFDLFEVEDIKKIMKTSKITSDDFVSLLKQSQPTINANELYNCTRKAIVYVKNLQDVILVLQTVKTYMKIEIFNEMIDFLYNTEKEISENSEQIKEENNQLKEELQHAEKAFLQVNADYIKLKKELRGGDNHKPFQNNESIDKLKEVCFQINEENIKLKLDVHDKEKLISQMSEEINTLNNSLQERERTIRQINDEKTI